MHVDVLTATEPAPEPDMEMLGPLVERAVGGPPLPDYDVPDGRAGIS